MTIPTWKSSSFESPAASGWRCRQLSAGSPPRGIVGFAAVIILRHRPLRAGSSPRNAQDLRWRDERRQSVFRWRFEENAPRSTTATVQCRGRGVLTLTRVLRRVIDSDSASVPRTPDGGHFPQDTHTHARRHRPVCRTVGSHIFHSFRPQSGYRVDFLESTLSRVRVPSRELAARVCPGSTSFDVVANFRTNSHRNKFNNNDIYCTLHCASYHFTRNASKS